MHRLSAILFSFYQVPPPSPPPCPLPPAHPLPSPGQHALGLHVGCGGSHDICSQNGLSPHPLSFLLHPTPKLTFLSGSEVQGLQSHAPAPLTPLLHPPTPRQHVYCVFFFACLHQCDPLVRTFVPSGMDVGSRSIAGSLGMPRRHVVPSCGSRQPHP